MSRALRSACTLVLVALAPLGCERCGDSQNAASRGESSGSRVRLESRSGSVTLEHGGTRSAAQPGALALKDALETGEDGHATVRFLDGRAIDVGANARFVLGESADGVVLELSRGIILSRGTGSSPGSGPAGSAIALSILTPYGLTRVGTGASDVSIDVRSDFAEVEVRLGNVELVQKDGASTAVNAGSRGQLGGGPAGGPAGATGTSRELTLPTLAVTLSARGARVELAAKGEKTFRPVGRAPVALVEGDVVRVRSGSPVLAVGGSDTELSLSPGSELTWEGASKDPTTHAEETRIALSRGALNLKLGADRPSRLRLGDTSLEARAGGLFTVERTARGLELGARVGDAQVGTHSPSGETSQMLEAGQHLRWEGGRGSPAAVGEELPRLSARSGQTVFHPGIPEVLLSWPGERGAYHVEVATSADFDHPLVSGLVHEPAVSVPAPRRGQLFWRVLAAGADPATATPLAQGSARFLPEPPRQELARLRNEVPEGSETTTIYFQDKPPSVTFTYKPDARALQYKIAVFQAEALDAPVVERSFPGDHAALEAGSLAEGNYVWSVTPMSKGGEALRGGKMTKLVLVYDNSVPSLLVVTPKNGDRAQPRVQVTGVAPVGAHLFVNEKSLALDAKHRFDAQVPPRGQPPMVVFRLTRGAGADAVIVRVLKSGR